ncbi:hypothetical protein [Streptomyces sp. NPDC049040]|uniref:hypothetical protein n=1 Tax=Streptomyces sp. NPDC049040 TaxID=3365593 RepID=UPI003713E7F0
MKYSKVAAVVAGSMMAVGVAAPAFAHTTGNETTSPAPTSVSGGVEQVLGAQPLQVVDSAQPLQTPGGPKASATVDTLAQAAADRLQGGAPADVIAAQAVTTAQGVAEAGLAGAAPAGAAPAAATPGTAMLGGLPAGAVAGALGLAGLAG